MIISHQGLHHELCGKASLLHRPGRSTLQVWAMLCSVVVCGACRQGEHAEPEHHTPAHQPRDFPTAISRVKDLHEEILSQPLVPRHPRPINDRDREQHDDRDHGDEHHQGSSHEQDDEAREIDALEEFQEVISILPRLAADSDLKEERWNVVNNTSMELTTMMASIGDPDPQRRRANYREQQSQIESSIRTLDGVALNFDSGHRNHHSHTSGHDQGDQHAHADGPTHDDRSVSTLDSPSGDKE